ncbi:hypothetical protein ABKN59_010557 [Abortiporus biennis]
MATLCYGIIVILATFAKTFEAWRASRQVGISTPITTLMIRDGMIYSLVLLLVTLPDIIIHFKDHIFGANVYGSFGITLATICVSRFILDLRSVVADTVSDTSCLTGVQLFRRCICLTQIPNVMINISSSSLSCQSTRRISNNRVSPQCLYFFLTLLCTQRNVSTVPHPLSHSDSLNLAQVTARQASDYIIIAVDIGSLLLDYSHYYCRTGIMSATTGGSDISDLNSSYVFNGYIYLVFSSITLLLYDIALTFDQEVEYIWKRKFNLASYVFILNRYLGALGACMGILVNSVLHGSDIVGYHATFVFFSLMIYRFYLVSGVEFLLSTSCIVANDVWLIMNVLTLITTYVFFIIRIWAIWNYHWFTLIMLIPPAISCFAAFTGLLAMTRFSFVTEDAIMIYGGCHWWWNGTEATLKRYESTLFCFMLPLISGSLAIILQITTLWSGAIVVVATFAKTFGTWKAAKQVGIRSPITSLIIRDGSIYSLVLFLSIIPDIVIDFHKMFGVNVVGSLGLTFATISISRFILDLRSAVTTPTDGIESGSLLDNYLPKFRGSVEDTADIPMFISQAITKLSRS